MTSCPLAVVLGDLDLVSCLGMARINTVPVAASNAPVTFSRFTRGAIDPGQQPDADMMVDLLLRFADAQKTRPVLYYQTDEDLLLVSRRRAELQQSFHYVVPEAELVEDLADKARFQHLAERLGLPVPRSRVLHPDVDATGRFDLKFPIVLKAATRAGLTKLPYPGKAVAVDSPSKLKMLWSQAAREGVKLIAQEMVVGPETAIESYHAYVDQRGGVVADFTGRKIRTQPQALGYSTAVCTTQSSDVAAAGRSLVRDLGLRGVLKADYKRDPTGHLHLLEVNPRFSLWNHLGAAAGVNLPALVYADLIARERGSVGVARTNLTWCQISGDRRAAAQAGMSTARWLGWVVRSSARAEGRWSDPMPLLRGVLLPQLRFERSGNVRPARRSAQ